MPPIPMPRLSDAMERGTIVRWLRAEGDEVRPGDELVEIETDKATMVYEAEAGGHHAVGAVDVGAAQQLFVEVTDRLQRVAARGPVHGDRIRRPAAVHGVGVVVDVLAEGLDAVARSAAEDAAAGEFEKASKLKPLDAMEKLDLEYARAQIE